MELLELIPPQRGIATPGVYVLDDDGDVVLAGPFPDVVEAIAWIDRTQEARQRGTAPPPS